MTELQIIRANIATTYSALAAYAMESRAVQRFHPPDQARCTTAMRFLDHARESLEGLEEAEKDKAQGTNFPP